MERLSETIGKKGSKWEWGSNNHRAEILDLTG